MIALNQVNKSYREGALERPVFSQLDLQVASGEIVALFGRSGTGKSTLLNLISGIDQPDSGTVCVNNQELTTASESLRTRFRRQHIGFIYQFFNLIPTLSVAENLRLPLELNRRYDYQRVEQLLQQVGLPDRGESFPDQLSGGEQQRVAIARALIHEPLLILADEPTGNLDVDTGAQILQLLVELTRAANHTLIIVSHSPETAEIADRVLTVHDHGVVEETQP
jgi:putative ABC transport system ATP-binding protein